MPPPLTPPTPRLPTPPTPPAPPAPLSSSRVPWAAGPRALRAWRLLLALLMLAVCMLAFDPNPPEQLDTGWDKLNHALAFVTLTLCASLALQRRSRRPLLAALAMLAFGAFIELVQTQIPGRSGEWLDLLADGVGIALALLAVSPLDRLLRLR